MTQSLKNLFVATSAALLPLGAYAVEIPVNIGVGPSLFSLPDSILKTRTQPFWGLNLKVKAILDKATIEKHKERIPAQYRKAISKTNEVRIGYLYIPANLIIAPGNNNGQPSIYGATWKPLSIDLPVNLGPASLSLGSELVLTYAAITTDLDDQTQGASNTTTTHFLRPGLSLNAELDVPLGKSFLVSMGAASAYYIPQRLKGVDETQDSLWRMSELRATFNYRFPVEVNF